MSSTDKVFEYQPAMTRAGLTSGGSGPNDRYYTVCLANEIVDIAVAGSAAITDLLVMADGHAWDGSGSFPDMLGGTEIWCILEAAGADVFYRCRPDNVSSMTATSQGEKIPDGDSVRFKLTKASRYLETFASGSGTLKKRFSNTPSF